MNLIKTEWKKIWYGKNIIHMLVVCFAVCLFCVALMMVARTNHGFVSVMQAYYEEGQTEPCNMPEHAVISPENTIGYILGVNDWEQPKGFEIYRSAMFPAFLFAILFLVYMASLYAKEYSRLMFRQAVFCGAGKLRAFLSKFLVNVIFCGSIYFVSIAGLYTFFSLYTGYRPSGGDIAVLLLAVLLNLLNFAVFESAAVLFVVYTKHSIVGIVANVLWFFSSFMIYPMLHKDFWGYGGKAMGIFAALSPGTYLYNICSAPVTKELVLYNILYAAGMLLVFWCVITWKLRRQEI